MTSTPLSSDAPRPGSRPSDAAPAMRALSCLLAIVAMGAAAQAQAFCTTASPADTLVKEYYDSSTDRYFLSWSHAISPGSCYSSYVEQLPPAGTTPTGLAWQTFAYGRYCLGSYPCSEPSTEVCQFKAAGQPEPASRFFTINAAACEALKQPGSGWVYEPASPYTWPERKASLAAFELDMHGAPACPGSTVPVYRFYNNRHAENLGNHRYVADEAVRQQMKARSGWVEEGIAFCALSASRPAVEPMAHSLAMQYPQGAGSWSCVNGFGSFATCVEAVNMVMPLTGRGPYAHVWYANPPMPALYPERTGVLSQYAVTYAFTTHEQSADHSFVQLYLRDPIVGLFVSSYDRIAGSVSGMRTWYRADSRPANWQRTIPLPRPFVRTFEVDMDLLLAVQVFVRRAMASSPGSDAYVMPLITFRDSASGKRLTLAPGSIGTPLPADSTGRDALTSNVLVAVALGPATSAGRSPALASMQLPAPFVSAEPWGRGGDFVYRINRTEFLRVIERARGVDPELGTDPGAYEIEGFGVKGEVVGDSDIGFNVRRLELSIVRP